METKTIHKATDSDQFRLLWRLDQFRAAEPVINAYNIVADSRKSDTGDMDQSDTAPAPLVSRLLESNQALSLIHI